MMIRVINPIAYVIIILLGLSLSVDAESGDAFLVSWHPSGEMIAYAHFDQITIIDVNTGEILNQFTDLPRQVTRPQWSPDGVYLAIAHGEYAEVWENAWDPEQSNLFGVQSLVNVFVRTMAWSPDGTRLAYAYGTYLEIWDIETNEIMVPPENPDVTRGMISEIVWYDNEHLLMSMWNPSIDLIHIPDGEIIAFFHANYRLEAGVASLAVNTRHDRVALGVVEGYLAVWDPSKGEIGEMTGLFYSSTPEIFIYAASSQVADVDWNLTEEYLATADQDGFIRVWDVATGTKLQEYEQPGKILYNSVAWSPDGTKLAFGSVAKGLQIVEGPPVTPQED